MEPTEKKRSRSEVFFTITKGLFFVLLILQIAPFIISNFKTNIEDAVSKSRVGYIAIKGILTDSSFYIKKIDDFYKAPDIKGLIVKINSPGGFPGTAQAIFMELNRFKQKKPVVIVVENMCASAAYYIAASGNRIICAPSSLIGSIGVLTELPNVKDLLNSWKIKFNYVQSGAYKTAGSPLKDMNVEERVYLQQLCDDTYQQFIKDVAKSRGLLVKDYKQWADGKVFSGTQALKLKLVDQIGSLNDGIEAMKKLANIQDDIKLIKAHRAKGLARLFSSKHETLSEVTASFMSSVYSKFVQYQAAAHSQPQIT